METHFATQAMTSDTNRGGASGLNAANSIWTMACLAVLGFALRVWYAHGPLWVDESGPSRTSRRSAIFGKFYGQSHRTITTTSIHLSLFRLSNQPQRNLARRLNRRRRRRDTTHGAIGRARSCRCARRRRDDGHVHVLCHIQRPGSRLRPRRSLLDRRLPPAREGNGRAGKPRALVFCACDRRGRFLPSRHVRGGLLVRARRIVRILRRERDLVRAIRKSLQLFWPTLVGLTPMLLCLVAGYVEVGGFILNFLRPYSPVLAFAGFSQMIVATLVGATAPVLIVAAIPLVSAGPSSSCANRRFPAFGEFPRHHALRSSHIRLHCKTSQQPYSPILFDLCNLSDPRSR